MSFGIERDFASVPTSDTERQSPFGNSRNWKPDQISIFNHNISIDIPTGNLIISTNDCVYPYYNFTLGINRKYDMQEQHMQLSYYRNYVNVNPKPHLFGNWQFAYEADVDEVWHSSCSELHVTSNIGANGLFVMDAHTFNRNIKKRSHINESLATYGIPTRTLSELDCTFSKNDFLLRTMRGDFRILAGHHQEETLVDDINTELWLFSPISGAAFNISSRYFYTVCNDTYRDIGYPLLVTKLTDSLGHSIELKPASINPPYQAYILRDGSDRSFYIELKHPLVYADGLATGREVRKYLATKVIDGTKTDNNELKYSYSNADLLEHIELPSTIGDRYVRYHYDNNDYPGILTSIENSFGERIRFEYLEDTDDNDERLNPRLKLKRIIDPEGISFEYDYRTNSSEVIVSILNNGHLDSKVYYKYCQDIKDSKQRYITLTEYKVTRGYETDSSDNIVARDPGNPQIVQNRIEYTDDGRFNVKKAIDPLNRITENEYNDFNQVIHSWDYDGHKTTNIYDIPDNPSASNPIRYDLLAVQQKNLLRIKDITGRRGFRDIVKLTKITYQYDRYDSDNSVYPNDHGLQSTHRMFKFTDEKNKTWTYLYDDSGTIDSSGDTSVLIPRNYWPIDPTTVRSPSGIEIHKTYNIRGENDSITDAGNNLYIYQYNPQGKLETFTNPNKETIRLYYYDCGNWLKRFDNQSGKSTVFERDQEGKVNTITDPANDSFAYEYYSNGRLKNVIFHRPSVTQDPAHPDNKTLNQEKLITEFKYMSLGKINRLTNPMGLGLVTDYDEAGRMINWYHDVPGYKPTKYVYNKAGHLTCVEDRNGNITCYTYHHSGLVKTVELPTWNDGIADKTGKLITYKIYDYRGRILTVTDSELGTSDYCYDASGNLVRRIDPDNFALNFKYDNDDRLKDILDDNGIYRYRHKLDDFGRPYLLTDSSYFDSSLSWKYNYQKTLPSGEKCVLNLYQITLPEIGLNTRFDYNESDLLKFIEHTTTGAGANTLFKQELQYRDDDLIENILHDNANSFRYDSTKQLIFEKEDDLSLDYDEAGNRLYRINRATSVLQNNQYDDQNNNRLLIDYGLKQTFGYDGNGNITQVNSVPASPAHKKEYYFDASNHLRLVRSDPWTIKYTYDHDGKLKKRILIDNTTGSIQSDYFRYLFTNPIIILRNDEIQMLLTWDPYGRLLRSRYKEAVGGAGAPHSLFPISDTRDITVKFLDSDLSEKIAIKYSVHGEAVELFDPGHIFEYIGYKGGLYDRETGHILFGARWYSPGIGRWISEDPSAYTATTNINYRTLNNLYSYALNDPVNQFDLTGLSVEDDIKDAVDWLETNYPELETKNAKIIYSERIDAGKAYGLPFDVILIGAYDSKKELVGLLAHERLHNKFGMAYAEKHSFMHHFERAVAEHYRLDQAAAGTFDKLTMAKEAVGMPYCSGPNIASIKWTGNIATMAGYKSIEEGLFVGAYYKAHKK